MPQLRLLMLGRLCFITCWMTFTLVASWYVYELTRSPFLLGMIGLAEAIPAIFGSLYSGHFVDQSRPHRVLVTSGIVLLLSLSALLMIVHLESHFSKEWILNALFLGIIITGFVRSFVMPSVISLISKTVPESALGAASAVSSSMQHMAQILGPVLAGLVYGWFGKTLAFAFPVIAVFLAIIFVLRLDPSIREFRPSHLREKFIPSFIAGLKFAFSKPVILQAMTLDMLCVLFGGVLAVLPVFADQVYKVGPEQLGLLRASSGLGSLVVSLWMAVAPPKVMTGKVLLFVVAGFGVATLAFAVTPWYWGGFILLALCGAFDGVSMVIRQTLLQVLVPPQMRGRLSALNSVFVTSSNEIGAFESGLAAQILGLVPSVVFGGTMTLLIVGMMCWKAVSLREARVQIG